MRRGVCIYKLRIAEFVTKKLFYFVSLGDFDGNAYLCTRQKSQPLPARRVKSRLQKWWNGRHERLKIFWDGSPVWVQVPLSVLIICSAANLLGCAAVSIKVSSGLKVFKVLKDPKDLKDSTI